LTATREAKWGALPTSELILVRAKYNRCLGILGANGTLARPAARDHEEGWEERSGDIR